MACRRILLVLAAFAVAFAVPFAIPATRVQILQSAAKILIQDELPIDKADVVIVAVDAGGDGLLEASDLFRSGVSTRVGVFSTPPGRVENELRRRGVPYPDMGSLFRRQLEALGVTNIVDVPRVYGTGDEGDVLAGWCNQHRYGSILVVTSWHHSRRLQRVLRRSAVGKSTKVAVRIARYSNFGPENWWQTHEGARIVLGEFQKLVVDFASHPLH